MATGNRAQATPANPGAGAGADLKAT